MCVFGSGSEGFSHFQHWPVLLMIYLLQMKLSCITHPYAKHSNMYSVLFFYFYFLFYLLLFPYYVKHMM